MLAVAALALGACGSAPETNLDRLGKAMCADLRDGLSIAQIYPAVSDDYTPQEFAGRAAVWAKNFCPDQLTVNEDLRGYLRAWGIDPSDV